MRLAMSLCAVLATSCGSDPQSAPSDAAVSVDALADAGDVDSDGDGLSDQDEGRPDDQDSDGDDVPDYLDLDSDGDWLPDADELAAATDPTEPDSDDDGDGDLAELATGTDPLDADDHPDAHGFAAVVVPHQAPALPSLASQAFRTWYPEADLYLLLDGTASMEGERAALQGALATIVADQTCAGGESPSVDGCVASVFTGAARYETELTNLQSLQSTVATTTAAMDYTGTGATEALYRALSDMAAGGGFGTPGGCVTPSPSVVGCPGFRATAKRIAVALTDEDSDLGQLAAAAAALQAAGITLVGVWTGSVADTARIALFDVIQASGSLDVDGDPLIRDAADAAVAAAVATLLQAALAPAARMTLLAEDLPDDDNLDALALIDHVEVETTGAGCTAVAVVEDSDLDGHPDTFLSVTPGTPLCWAVAPRTNDAIEPAAAPRVIAASLTARAGAAVVDRREVRFVVPRAF